MDLQTPAKLNLGLRLTGLRDDGYHLLESVFAPIEVFDRLEIEIQPGALDIELEVSLSAKSVLPPALAAVGSGPDNLAFRAAAAYCEATGLEGRIRMHLEKAIPAAAGLGGGSSDAAAVLNGLSALCDEGRRPGPAQLARIALALGADVPFFLDPRPSLVSGIGDVITPLDGLPSAHLVVANPGISVDTAEVYRVTDAIGGALTDPRPGSTMRAFSQLCQEYGGLLGGNEPGLSPNRGDDEGISASELGSRARTLWSELLINDLEPAARRLCPPVGRLLESVRDAGATGAGMTGSGGTVFGVFESSVAAEEAADQLRGPADSDAGPAWVSVSRLIGQR